MTEPAIRQRQAVDLDEFERRLRAVAPTAKPTEDPLAELARLVGQDDPFKQVFAEPIRTESARPERPRIEPTRAEPPRILRREPPPLNPVPDTRPGSPGFAELRAASGSLELQETPQDPFWDRHRVPEAADAGRGSERADGLYGAPTTSGPADDEQWLGEDGQLPPPPEEARPPRRGRRGLYALSVIAALAAVSAGGFYAFKGASVMGTSDPPTIRAAVGPAKIAPASTSSDVADQDTTVLDRNPADGAQQTQVVTREEQPVDLAQTTNAAAPRSDDALASPTPPMEPKRVKTVTVRPDGSIVAEDGASPSRSIAPIAPPIAPNPVQLPPAAKALDSAPAAPAAVAKTATPKTTVRVATTPKATTAGAGNLAAGQPAKPRPAAKVAAPPPTPAADTVEADATQPQATDSMPTGATGPTNDAAASGGAGGFAVQLAAPASEQEARDAATRLQKKFSAELAAYHPTIHRADAAGKQVYRVRVGNLTREDAVSLCEKLKAGGGACFIAKN
jgi:hypothetical protein